MQTSHHIELSPPSDRFQDEVGRLLSHYRSSKRTPVSMVSRHWYPLVDVFEADDAIYVIADLAGVKEDEVELVAEGTQVMLTGERGQCGPGRRRRYHQKEIPAGPFERQIDLPPHADIGKAVASYNNGILEIRIPLTDREVPHNVTIRVR